MTRTRATKGRLDGVLLWRLVATTLALEAVALLVSFATNAWNCGFLGQTACSSVARVDLPAVEFVLPAVLVCLLGAALAWGRRPSGDHSQDS